MEREIHDSAAPAIPGLTPAAILVRQAHDYPYAEAEKADRSGGVRNFLLSAIAAVYDHADAARRGRHRRVSATRAVPGP
jgi:hypothetical protein